MTEPTHESDESAPSWEPAPSREAAELQPLFEALRADEAPPPMDRMRRRFRELLRSSSASPTGSAGLVNGRHELDHAGPSRLLRAAGLLFVLLAIGAILALGRSQLQPVYALVDATGGQCSVQTEDGWLRVLRPRLECGTVLRAGERGCELRLRCGGRISLAPRSILRFRDCPEAGRVVLDAPPLGVELVSGKAPLPFAVGDSLFECRGRCQVKSSCRKHTRFEILVSEGCCQDLGAKQPCKQRFEVDCSSCKGCSESR
jgi:hypothetical protein